MERTTIKLENYKSFDVPGAVISGFKPFNLIVGRNNSGKSALIDAIAIATGSLNIRENNTRVHEDSCLVFGRNLTRPEVESNFRNVSSNWNLMEQIGEFLIDTYIEFPLYSVNSRKLEISKPEHPGAAHRIEQYAVSGLYHNLRDRVINPFSGKYFRKMDAERDVKPESFQKSIASSGVGVTGTLATFMHKDGHKRELVKDVILDRINEILYPDTKFQEIVLRNYDDGTWEIFLSNYDGKLVRIRDSGSGLKTIIMMVSFIELMPFIDGVDLKDYIFAFEEPENNLHPAVQRRLVNYVLSRCREAGFTVFMTTHSAAVIDAVSGELDAQILHVVHSGKRAEVRRVEAVRDSHSVIDDLGVRASDLLQSNCLVWLEGPSDRIYFNRWMELCSENDLREGLHYQCLYYGGKVLSHFSFSNDEDNSEGLIEAIRVNRNSIVIMDSDLTSNASRINSTKARVRKEVEDAGGICWISCGREVENYIPDTALAKKLGKRKARLGMYVDIKDYLNNNSSKSGDKFERTKVLFAREIAGLLSQSDLNSRYEWRKNMNRCVDFIKKCNGLV